MNIDFDNKVILISQVLDALLDEETLGQHVEDILNDGGYDTDGVRDDLEAFEQDDSTIMEEILSDASFAWTPFQRVLFDAMSNVFIRGITNYQRLTQKPTFETIDESKDVDSDNNENARFLDTVRRAVSLTNANITSARQ